jgi:phosphoribosylglycinamide formyltransferase-1
LCNQKIAELKKIVLFASGSGSNAENIIRHYKNNGKATISAIFCNNPNAQVIERAAALEVAVILFTKDELAENNVLSVLLQMNPDLIVLAGFLLKFPANIIQAFPDKIINIHPALLPKYGGKGMYGMNVHRSVYLNRDLESGISIHFVNENYDEGNLIFSKSVAISECASPEDIAAKIHALEHEYYPKVIDQLLFPESN